MKKSVLTIIVLCITFCSLSARHKKQNHVNSEIQSIYMQHSACMGKCPDFGIEVNNNGTVKYTGYRFVKDSGFMKKKSA